MDTVKRDRGNPAHSSVCVWGGVKEGERTVREREREREGGGEGGREKEREKGG